MRRASLARPMLRHSDEQQQPHRRAPAGPARTAGGRPCSFSRHHRPGGAAALLAGRRPHLARRPAHAADPLERDGRIAARADREPRPRPRARVADAHGLLRRLARRRDGAARAPAQEPGRDVLGGPATAWARGHRAGRTRAPGHRRRARPALRRVHLEELVRRRGTFALVGHRRRTDVLDADRLRVGLHHRVHGPPGVVPRGRVPVDGADALPHRRPAGRRLGRRSDRRSALPARRDVHARTLGDAGAARRRSRDAAALGTAAARLRRRPDGRRLARFQLGVPHGQACRLDAGHRAFPRRERCRQGGVRAHAAPHQPAPHAGLRCRQLRGDSGGAGRG